MSKELEEIIAAFKIWQFDKAHGQNSFISATTETAELFLPFLEMHFRRERTGGGGVYADEMREVYRLKKKLGMKLMAHEVVND